MIFNHPDDSFVANGMALPGQIITLEFRPIVAFRLSGFALLNDCPSNWAVHSIVIHEKEQLIKIGHIPFDIITGDYPIDYPTVTPGQHIKLSVQNQTKEQRRIRAMLQGRFNPSF